MEMKYASLILVQTVELLINELLRTRWNTIWDKKEKEIHSITSHSFNILENSFIFLGEIHVFAVNGSGTQSQMVLQRTLEWNHNHIHNPSQIHNRIYTQMLAVVAIIIIIVAIAANKIAEFIILPLLL